MMTGIKSNMWRESIDYDPAMINTVIVIHMAMNIVVHILIRIIVILIVNT